MHQNYAAVFNIYSFPLNAESKDFNARSGRLSRVGGLPHLQSFYWVRICISLPAMFIFLMLYNIAKGKTKNKLIITFQSTANTAIVLAVAFCQ